MVAGLRRQNKAGKSWGALLWYGIAGIVIGALTFMWPGVTAVTLLIMIATWAIVTGVFEIVAAIRLRKLITGELFMGLSGLASVLFGLMLIINPGVGALAVVWLIGLYTIISGAILIALAFRLRRWATRNQATAPAV